MQPRRVDRRRGVFREAVSTGPAVGRGYRATDSRFRHKSRSEPFYAAPAKLAAVGQLTIHPLQLWARRILVLAIAAETSSSITLGRTAVKNRFDAKWQR